MIILLQKLIGNAYWQDADHRVRDLGIDHLPNLEDIEVSQVINNLIESKNQGDYRYYALEGGKVAVYRFKINAVTTYSLLGEADKVVLEIEKDDTDG